MFLLAISDALTGSVGIVSLLCLLFEYSLIHKGSFLELGSHWTLRVNDFAAFDRLMGCELDKKVRRRLLVLPRYDMLHQTHADQKLTISYS